MDVNELKLFMGRAIYKSPKLSESSKVKLINYLRREHDEGRLLSLLLDGTVKKVTLKEEKVLKERFEKSEYNKIIQEISKRKSFMSTLGLATIIGPVLTRTIRAAYDNCTRHCGVYAMNYLSRQLCMITCKRNYVNKELELLKKQLGDCQHGKNPDKCRQKIEAAIKKTEASLAKIDQTIAQYKKEVAGKRAVKQVQAAIGAEKGEVSKEKMTKNIYRSTLR